MAGEEKKRELEGRLECLGRTVVRAYASNDEEAEAAARSPFAYARLRARIHSEAARREEGDGWLAVLGVVWRAVPAMALVAVLACAPRAANVRASTRAAGRTSSSACAATSA